MAKKVNKKMKSKELPEYELGSYVESPWTSLYENQIAIAKAMNTAQDNPWAKGLGIVGNLGMQIGSGMMGKGMSQGQGVTQGGFNWGSLLHGGIQTGGAMANSGMFEMGGIVDDVAINAEGGEIVETPDGQMEELVGPSHAEGGIDMVVPETTEIYSDKLKGSDGKTMAQRKKARENRASKAEKLLQANPSDKTLKNTYEKILADNEKLDAQDLQEMQLARMLDGVSEQYKSGGIVGVQKFLFGGSVGKNPFGPNPYPPNPDFQDWDIDANQIPDLIQDPMAENIWDNTLDELVIPANYGNRDLSGRTPAGLNIPPLSTNPINPERKYSGSNLGGNTTGANSDDGTGSSWGNFNITAGDATGLMGQLYNTFMPMRNTIANRAGDTPNINPYKDFGKDALAKMDKSKQGLRQNRDAALSDLELTRGTSSSRNRNSARGINTMRALDLATDAQINKNKGDVYGQFASLMSNIYQQEAQLENQQDQMVMQGEEKRDIADRMDRDNFNTQLARDMATKGKGLQHIGKTMNQIKTRNVTGNALNQLYENFGINTMTGEVKAKAKSIIDEDPGFWTGVTSPNKGDIIGKISKDIYKKVGNYIIDVATGKNVDLETGLPVDN